MNNSAQEMFTHIFPGTNEDMTKLLCTLEAEILRTHVKALHVSHAKRSLKSGVLTTPRSIPLDSVRLTSMVHAITTLACRVKELAPNAVSVLTKLVEEYRPEMHVKLMAVQAVALLRSHIEAGSSDAADNAPTNGEVHISELMMVEGVEDTNMESKSSHRGRKLWSEPQLVSGSSDPVAVQVCHRGGEENDIVVIRVSVVNLTVAPMPHVRISLRTKGMLAFSSDADHIIVWKNLPPNITKCWDCRMSVSSFSRSSITVMLSWDMVRLV